MLNETSETTNVTNNSETTNKENKMNKSEFASITEMREETYEAYKAGLITLDEASKISKYLAKREYNQIRNKRPEVREARKAYNQKQAENRKEGKILLSLLIANKK